MRLTPFKDSESRFQAGRFGIGLFLASLGMLFAASLVAYIMVRWELGFRGAWPADLPSLPKGLLLSTAILLVSSATIQHALNGIRSGRVEQLRSNLLLTLLLGLAFLLIQSRCWLAWLVPVSQRWSDSNEFRFALTSFYVLTGIHALHVLGGLVSLTIVARNAFAGAYSSQSYGPVHYVAVYWHFLGAVWIVLYATLLIGSR